MVKGKVAEDEAVPKAVARTFPMLPMKRNGSERVKMTENLKRNEGSVLHFYSLVKIVGFKLRQNGYILFFGISCEGLVSWSFTPCNHQ